MTPPQLHAADWTEFKVTHTSIQQLDGLKFSGKVEGSPLLGGNPFSDSANLWILDEGQGFRFAGAMWGRPFDYEKDVRIRRGKLRMAFARKHRLWTVERNSAGKFRISTEFESPGREVSTITVVLTQE